MASVDLNSLEQVSPDGVFKDKSGYWTGTSPDNAQYRGTYYGGGGPGGIFGMSDAPAPATVKPTAPAPGVGSPSPYGNDNQLTPTTQRSTNPGLSLTMPTLPSPTYQTSTNTGITARGVTTGAYTPTPLPFVPAPGTGPSGPTPSPTPTSGGTGGDPIAAIRQYQSSHPAAGGSSLDDMVSFLKSQGINASRYMYGNVPSNNELDIPGYGKYKVYSEAGNSWYYGGDEGGGGQPTASGYTPPSTGGAATPSGPMNYQQALAYVQGKVGKQLTQGQIDSAFAKFGGSPSDTFYASGLDPVVAWLGGGGGLTPPGAGPYPGGGGGLPTQPYVDQTFTDPATAYYEQLLKLYSQKLLEPVNNPAQAQLYDLLSQAIAKYQNPVGPYESAATTRIGELQGPLFTDPQYDTLRTGMFDDLEHQRQQALQNVTEQMASHGHGQTSGTLAEALRQTNQYFDQLRAQKQNAFDQQVIAMQEDRRNQVVDLSKAISDAQQGRIGSQLSLSGNLSGLVANDQDTQLSRDAQAVASGAALAELPERRLQLALQTYGVGGGPTTPLSQTAIQLQNMLTNNQLIAQQQRNSFAQGMGNYIGYLINSGVFSSGAKGATTPQVASYTPSMTNGFG